MALEVAVSQNGRNGRSVLDDGEYRRSLVSLAIFGSPSDAQAMFLAIPGATSDDWAVFERSLAALRAYVQEGNSSYVRPLVAVDLWSGVPTPDGDCAEDSKTGEYINPARREIEREWFEIKKLGVSNAV